MKSSVRLSQHEAIRHISENIETFCDCSRKRSFSFATETKEFKGVEKYMFNYLKTGALLAVLTALFIFIGYFFGGTFGIVIALVMAAVLNFGAYWFSDKIVLKMYRAQEVSETQAPELFEMVRVLAQRVKIPMPKVYIIPEMNPNAFATGRNPNHAAVAVTEGIMQMLTRDELFGVLAHEIGHIKNRDTLIMTVAGGIAGAVSMLTDIVMWSMIFGGSDDEGEGNSWVGFLGLLFAPFLAMMIQFSISRSREFVADEWGAKLSGNPLALASALRKLENYGRKVPIHSGSPSTAHLFIVNPFSGRAFANLFSTHPLTEKRIERLEELNRRKIGQLEFASAN
jgi:heat shock protein HtpX